MPMQCKIYALVADLVLIREGAENRRAEGRKKMHTFATLSASPETVSTRSCTPGTTLLTPAFTPVSSLRLATLLPPLPMMTPASLVLTRARRVRVSLGEVEGA